MVRMKALPLLIGMSLTVFAACAYQKVEQPTPAGKIAPPVPVRSAKPYRNPNVRPATSEHASTTSETARLPDAIPAGEADTLGEFARAYIRKGSPKMAIFLNLPRSDDVKEWGTTTRGIVPVKKEIFGKSDKAEASSGKPGVGWAWHFENGFLGPFLEVGANIVDPQTVAQLAATDAGGQGRTHDSGTADKIAMDPLIGEADLFIEIVIKRSPEFRLGYEFKANAREVETGIVRAGVTSIGWEYVTESSAKGSAPSPYQSGKGADASNLPEVEIVSRDLALALMQALADNWQR